MRDCRLDDGVLELAADDNESMDNAVALACDFADMDLLVLQIDKVVDVKPRN